MIRTGDSLRNPVTGEELRFVETAADTGGEYVLVEARILPDGAVADAHLHPYQSERFEILRGTVGFRVGAEEVIARAGHVVVVEPGTAHRFWNAGESEANFRTEVARPCSSSGSSRRCSPSRATAE